MEGNPAYRPLLDKPYLTVEGLTTHFSRALVNGLAETSPNLATDFVLERFESGDKSAPQMMHAIVGAQFQTGDPTKATNWIESIPESSLKNTTMHRVAGQIASENPQQAPHLAARHSRKRKPLARHRSHPSHLGRKEPRKSSRLHFSHACLIRQRRRRLRLRHPRRPRQSRRRHRLGLVYSGPRLPHLGPCRYRTRLHAKGSEAARQWLENSNLPRRRFKESRAKNNLLL